MAGFPAAETMDEFNYDFANGVKGRQIEEPRGMGSWSDIRAGRGERRRRDTGRWRNLLALFGVGKQKFCSKISIKTGFPNK
jgi:hypothetical protein